MADIVRHRNERTEQRGAPLPPIAAIEPLRTMWALLGGEDPARDLERVFRWEQQRAFVPRFDVRETKDAYVFTADLPGVPEQAVEISLVGNRLTITGRREEERVEPGENYYAAERSYGAFARTFILPDGADADNVRAEMKDGVLTVTVPKRPEAQPKKIQLSKSESPEPQQGQSQQSQH